MPMYLVHNGYCGWSYGTPSDPQLVSARDAAEIMRRANLSMDQVRLCVPAAQYANGGEPLCDLTGGNRFLFLGEVSQCVEVDSKKVDLPLHIKWPEA